MMRRLEVVIGIVFMVMIGQALYSLTGEEAVEKFRIRMYQLEKLTGVISWTSLDGQSYSGSFKYLAPDKIYVKFTSPEQKVLVSNGKTLWIYSPGTGICGTHELEKGTTSGGIAGIVTGYDGIATEGDTGYTIKLRDDAKTFREIVLSVDTSFLLKGAIFKRDDGRVMSFSISDVSTEADVNPKIFKFRIPKGVKVLSNPGDMR